jgi:hypothetical protein
VLAGLVNSEGPGRARDHHIKWPRRTNKGISAPRAESWEQVYELVKARAAELETKERG